MMSQIVPLKIYHSAVLAIIRSQVSPLTVSRHPEGGENIDLGQ